MTTETTIVEHETPTTAIAEYSETEKSLQELESRLDGVVYTLTTTAGNKEARDDRALCVKLRTGLEKKRKELNADDQARIAKRNDLAKSLTERIEKLEKPIDDAIKADEKRREEEKAARIKAEQDRVSAIHERIAGIRNVALQAAGWSAETLSRAIAALDAREVAIDDFQEFCGQAQLAKDETLDKLRAAHTDVVAREEQAAREKAEREAEAARLKAEREELDRLKAEQAERERIAAEERAQAEAAAKAEREAEEAKARVAREAEEARMHAEHEAKVAELNRQREQQEAELKAQREEMARQQAEIDRQRREQEEAAERARLEREAAERAEQERIAAEQRKAAEEAAAKQAEAERQEREKARTEYRAKLAAAYARVLAKPLALDDLMQLLSDAGIDDSLADPLVLAMAEANLRISFNDEVMQQAA